MGMISRLSVVLALFLGNMTLPALGATAPEKAFNFAANLYNAGNYEKAEAEFAKFGQDFPSSPKLPEAVLYQAEARFKQTNYNGTIELLESRLTAVGAWADQYLFWIGESYVKQGKFKPAIERFARVV